MTTAEGVLIDWTSSAERVAALVRKGAGSPPFSYLKGTRIALLEAAACKGRPDAKPGTITDVFADGTFTVTAGEGSLHVRRCRINFWVHETGDLKRVLEVFGLAPPQQLQNRPYVDNRDPTIWERAVRLWSTGHIDWRKAEYMPDAQHPKAGIINANLPYFSWLFDSLGVEPEGQCLDIGCGDGWAMAAWELLGRKVAGFDVAEGGLASSRRHVAGAIVDELDYYDAGDHYQRTGLEFDFMFCRGLGIAQKLLDWSDPAWLEATASLARRLRPGGVMWWSQLSDRSGHMTGEGFTNAPAWVLDGAFRAAGLRCLSLTVFGALFVLLLVRPDFPEARMKRFHEINDGVWRSALERYRTEVKRPAAGVAVASRDTIANGFRAACGLLSRQLLDPGEDGARLIIAGTDSVAQLFGRAALLLKIPVVAYWSSSGDGERRGLEAPIGRVGEHLGPVPQPAVLLADPELEPLVARVGAEHVISPWKAHRIEVDRVYLISGDQDEAVMDGVRSFMAGFADWVPGVPAAEDMVGQGAAVVIDSPLQPAPATAAEDMVGQGAVDVIDSPQQPASATTAEDVVGQGAVDVIDSPRQPAPATTAVHPREPSPEISDLLPGWTRHGSGRAEVRSGVIVTVGLDGQEITFHRTATSPATLRFAAARRSGAAHDCRAVLGNGNRGAVLALGPGEVSLWTNTGDIERAGRGLWARLGLAKPAAGSAIVATSDWHSYEIELAHDLVTVNVDGQRLLSSALERPVRGTIDIAIGLWKSHSDSEAEWRHVSVASDESS